MKGTSDVAIRVSGVSKAFKLPHEKQSSVKSLFLSMFHGKRTFERQQVLQDISFEVKKGEFFGIVGRNGSGKSTLLKMLAGIYTPDKGHIQINGKLTPFIELGVGFNPELTGRENVFLNGSLLGFTRNEMAGMYDEIVEFAELERFMDQKLKNYSSGMQVRLAFSIAIRANTEILVLDEVLAVGDVNFQKKCFEYFRQLKNEKKTVILVSHDMDSVRRFSDRALLLEKSKAIMIGDPDDVSKEYMRRNVADPNEEKSENKDKKSKLQPVKILNAELLDSSGKKVYEIESDAENLAISIKYEIEASTKNLNFGIGLWSETGAYVFSYNTLMDDYKVTPGSKILLRLPKVPLLSGAYYFNIACFGKDEASPYDYKERAIKFDVYTKGRAKKYRGLLRLEHSWEASHE